MKDKFIKRNFEYYINPVRNNKVLDFLSNILSRKIHNMSENKQVSIIFFGITRSLGFTLPYIQKNIIKVLDDNNISWHIYIHTYDQKNIINHRSGEDNAQVDYKKDLSLLPQDKITVSVSSDAEFLKNLDLKKITIHGDPWEGEDGTDTFKSLKNLMLQLNSLKIVMKLADITHNKSQAYLFIRPDLAYIDPLPIELVKNCIDNSDTRIIYTPEWGKYKGGLNDRFAIATPTSALTYGTRLDKSEEYASKNVLHSESFLANVIGKYNQNGLKARALRIRANGCINKRDIDLFQLDRKSLSNIVKKIPRAGKLRVQKMTSR